MEDKGESPGYVGKKKTPDLWLYVETLKNLSIDDGEIKALRDNLLENIEMLKFSGGTIVMQINNFAEEINIFTENEIAQDLPAVRYMQSYMILNQNLYVLKNRELDAFTNCLKKVIGLLDNRVAAREKFLEGIRASVWRAVIKGMIAGDETVKIKDALNARFPDNVELIEGEIQEFINFMAEGDDDGKEERAR